MVSFGIDILVYAASPLAHAQAGRARDVMERAMHAGAGVLVLHTLAEFCDLGQRARVPVHEIERLVEAWRAVLEVVAPEEHDYWAALTELRAFRRYQEALLWAAAKRAGVKHILTGTMIDGYDLKGVIFVNPLSAQNDKLIDRILPRLRRRR